MSSPAHKPLVYIISAPSGSGKSTLVNELLKKVSDLEFSISYTTRAPRGSETNGRQYYFVSRPEFEKMIRDDEFLEHAEVFGNYYGTARRFLREAEQNGRDLLLDIDVQGAAQIQRQTPRRHQHLHSASGSQDAGRTFAQAQRRSRGGDPAPPGSRRPARLRITTATTTFSINDQLEDSIKLLRAIVRGERLLRAGQPLSAEEAKDRGPRGALPPGQCSRPPEADSGLV